MAKIYVGNLPYTTGDEDELYSLFAGYGTVHTVELAIDGQTGRFRGFAFVEMDDAEANNAIQALNGKDFNGRSMTVSLTGQAGQQPGRNEGRAEW